MRKIVLSVYMVVCVLAGASPAWAQGALDQRISELSQKISNGLTENRKRTIAVVEFADLRGNVTDFGRFIAEELITRLYETKKFTVIERQLLNKVVAEQKLSLTGMIDQTSAQKLGKLLGVDAIATGTVTDLGKSLRVNARLIDTSTAVIFAVASTEITKDDSVMTLMGAIAAGPTSPGASGSGTSYHGNAIASKDTRSLRVVLKSVMPVKLKDQNGRSVNSIRCAFEFINLEAQRSIVVAMNAEAGKNFQIGDHLRSTLVDENGGLWRLQNTDVAGMSIVGVGIQKPYGPNYDPAEIVTVLSKRDDLNSDFSRGTYAYGAVGEYRFIFGSTTEMSPGQTLTVTMNFAQDDNLTSGPPPKAFQMATEVVVGVVTIGTKKSYTLHNLTFDRVSIPGGDAVR